ncbi:MAG TPA: PQQ-dependent sugar dehydrogenase [Magnetospirillum sp.]|jgi:glucose/arabinose dehydrogenase|nr:PQQ-dependent sugar dehydrogenase [Magnetospirillum sp.]
MTTTVKINGTSGADTLNGTAASDLIYGYDPASADAAPIRADLIASGLSTPLAATAPAGDLTHLFVAEQGGRIEAIDLTTNQIEAHPFLDLSSEVRAAGEGGLTGLAFDPGYATNGLFYVTMTNQAGNIELRAFHATPGALQADPTSSHTLMTVDHPEFTNHYGGWLGFGPDGMLYVGLGDGGGAGDPFGNAQNADSLLGKILRIDVSHDGFPLDPSRDYAIPPDNPFVNGPGAGEVWALGLRNPWRASFDVDGQLYIGDVGQDRFEEVDLGRAGGNYGWNLFEGNAPFAAPAGTPNTFVAPIFVYDHSLGDAIIGGEVYRGPAEGLQGAYFFSDNGSGRLWTLRPSDGGFSATDRTGQLQYSSTARLEHPTSFGNDGNGNLYVTDQDGDVFRLTPQGRPVDGADTINGGPGDDILFGGPGNDVITGGAGNDRLMGQSGNDTLNGGPGTDSLTGGPGADRFVVTSGHETITDFTPGTDVLQTRFGASAIQLAHQSGPDVVLDLGEDVQATLKNIALSDLHSGDFVLG